MKKLLFAIIMTGSFVAAADEVSPLVDKLFKIGIKNYTCKISGREILNTSRGLEDLGQTTRLKPRSIFASSEQEAIKLCLIKVNANLSYGPRKEGGGVRFVISIKDIPELEASRLNLFLADELEVRELKSF